MASLSMAKAILTSALLRRDNKAPEIRREDATHFIKSLHKAMNICTASQVKACKGFIVRCITPSSARTTALIKYLLVVAKASGSPRATDASSGGDEFEGLQVANGTVQQQPPTPAYRRLHLLHVLHDVLCFLTLRMKDPAHSQEMFCADLALYSLKGYAGIFMQLASCRDGNLDSNGSGTGNRFGFGISSRDSSSNARSSTLPKVQTILAIWERNGFFTAEEAARLRTNVEKAGVSDFEAYLPQITSEEVLAAVETQRREKEANKWIVPLRHGVTSDPDAHWSELPATNALYMKQTKGYMRGDQLPRGGYQLQNGGREADDDMKMLVMDAVNSAKRCFDPYYDPNDVADVDALGNIIWKDPARPTTNHWGFSYDLLEKKKRARVQAGIEQHSGGDDRMDEEDHVYRPSFGLRG